MSLSSYSDVFGITHDHLAGEEVLGASTTTAADDRAALEALVVAVTKLMPWESRLPFVPIEQRVAHRAWCAALAHIGMTEKDAYAAAKTQIEAATVAEKAAR